MGLHWHILGLPQRDNALWVEVRRGQGVMRLLFDCGDGCLWSRSFFEIGELDHLLFSHLHMDHVAGFDNFFRLCYGREHKPNHIWGPERTAQIVQHRMQGVMWNLPPRNEAVWQVHNLGETSHHHHSLQLSEHFSVLRLDNTEAVAPTPTMIIEHRDFTVSRLVLDHLTPSCGYVVRETNKRNIDIERLHAMGFSSGPWLKVLREDYAIKTLELNGQTLDLDSIRHEVITETPGESIAYLTDFLLDEAARAKLLPFLHDITTIVCESQYLHSDIELAKRHHHMTSQQAAQLAHDAGATTLCLFHISERYNRAQCQQLLDEAQAIFANTSLGQDWAWPQQEHGA
jgi:ribonuclease Z